VKVMAKVNKAFSIDPETFMMLDRYCAASETWDKRRSRSAIVNEAIRWYLQGDNADMITQSHKELLENYQRVCQENTQLRERITVYPPIGGPRSWWKKILGLRV
tara:strand:- start:213 stop:524 length:312 start_codon:yes stop_codon:yes gene_type:complete